MQSLRKIKPPAHLQKVRTFEIWRYSKWSEVMKTAAERIEQKLEHLAQKAAHGAGSSWAFSIALMTFVV